MDEETERVRAPTNTSGVTEVWAFVQSDWPERTRIKPLVSCAKIDFSATETYDFGLPFFGFG